MKPAKAPALLDTSLLVRYLTGESTNLQMTDLPKTRALEALRLCRDSNRHSLPDALLWAQALEHGAEAIYSFDRNFPSQGLPVRH